MHIGHAPGYVPFKLSGQAYSYLLNPLCTFNAFFSLILQKRRLETIEKEVCCVYFMVWYILWHNRMYAYCCAVHMM